MPIVKIAFACPILAARSQASIRTSIWFSLPSKHDASGSSSLALNDVNPTGRPNNYQQADPRDCKSLQHEIPSRVAYPLVDSRFVYKAFPLCTQLQHGPSSRRGPTKRSTKPFCMDLPRALGQIVASLTERQGRHGLFSLKPFHTRNAGPNPKAGVAGKTSHWSLEAFGLSAAKTLGGAVLQSATLPSFCYHPSREQRHRTLHPVLDS